METSDTNEPNPPPNSTNGGTDVPEETAKVVDVSVDATSGAEPARVPTPEGFTEAPSGVEIPGDATTPEGTTAPMPPPELFVHPEPPSPHLPPPPPVPTFEGSSPRPPQTSPVRYEPRLGPRPPARPRRKLSARGLALLGGAVGVGLMVCLVAPLALRHGDEPPAPSATESAAVTTLGSAPLIPAVPSSSSPAPAPPPSPPVTPTWRIASLSSDPTVQLVEGTIGRRPMLTVLQGAGLSHAEAYRVLNAFDGGADDRKLRFDRLAPKDTFTVAKERATGRVLAFELVKSPSEVWQARETDGKLEGKRLELRIEHVRVAVGVLVDGELRDSVVKAGLDDDVLELLDDALEGHAELSDVRRGARLRIVATEERIEGAFTRYAELDAVDYTPARAGAAPLRIYWYSRGDSDGERGAGSGKAKGGFYDAKGQQPYQGGWRKPVPLARISSRFNPKRKHPVLHIIMPHNGVDFAAPPGTPVYATASGTVRLAGDGGACGNMVQILHPNGLVSGYCHLSRFAAGLRAGQHVEMRQLVGYVGQTGRVTGPHLHFLIKRGDQFIDPLSLKLDGVRVLPSSDREAFARRKQELDGALEKVTLPAPMAAGTEPEAPPEETVYEEPP